MKKDILLISMPWPEAHQPSIQLAGLKSFLRQHKIQVEANSLYVKFADLIGFNKYSYISSWSTFLGEAVFAGVLYPAKRKQVLSLFKRNRHKRFNFDNIILQADHFLGNTLKTIDFSIYKFVGFSIVFNQIFASLALAKRIKEACPQVKIVFGGQAVSGEKGIRFMQNYPFIDYIISYEGEIALLQLLRKQGLNSISSLTHRQNDQVVMYPPAKRVISLDGLPLPDFSEFFSQIKEAKKIKKSKFVYSFPVEAARGCWWNKCTFCTLNNQHLKYREKSYKKIFQEVKQQKQKYNCSEVSFVNNNINLKDTKKIFTSLKALNLKIRLEYSARMRDFNLLLTLKESGVAEIQFGLESLSKTLLEQKINKGTRLIDNIQMMKWLRELNIASCSNLITNYPNETPKEFNEVIRNFKYLYHLEPPLLSPFGLSYRSYIFNNYREFNIKKFFLCKVYSQFIPRNILQNLILNEYDFIKEIKRRYPQKILNKELHRWIEKFLVRSPYPLLYFLSTDEELKIIDKRGDKIIKYLLDKPESYVYLFCQNARELSEIQANFSEFSGKYLLSILNDFVKEHLMFRDENYYLSLAIDWNRHKRYLLRDKIKNHLFNVCRKVNLTK